MLKQESQHTEWKETWRDDYLRWVCGFANAQGGRLLLGVNDKGQVVGLPDAAKLLEDLPNKVRDLLGIVVDVNLHTEADLPYLALMVQAYPNPISYRGHYYMPTCAAAARCKRSKARRWIVFCWVAMVALGTACRCPSSAWTMCRPRPWRGFASWPSAAGGSMPKPWPRVMPICWTSCD